MTDTECGYAAAPRGGLVEGKRVLSGRELRQRFAQGGTHWTHWAYALEEVLGAFSCAGLL